VLCNPVLSGEACVNDATLNVDRHLLGTAQGALNGIVINIGEVAAAMHVDLPARSSEKCHSCILEAPLGDT